MNNVVLIGRLTKDPVVHKGDDGFTVCNFNLAIGDYASKNDHVDYLRVKVFGIQAATCERYLKKGLLTAVEGRLRSDQYTDADGIVRYPVDVIANRVEFLQWPELKTTRVTDTPAEVSALADTSDLLDAGNLLDDSNLVDSIKPL